MNTFASVRILPVTIVGVAVVLSACASPARSVVAAHPSAPTVTSPAGTPDPTQPSTTTTPIPATSTPPPPATSPVAANRGSLDGLANATLDLPGWVPASGACPSGPTKFTNGSSGSFTKINYVGTSDVDRDGSTDIVALIGCAPGEGFGNQAIAFHRHADGTVTTIGLIAAADPDSTAFDDRVQNIGGLHPGTDGTVGVDVGSYETTYSTYGETGIWQTRTFRWNGRTFVQVAGPISFIAPTSVHLSMTASPMHFRKPAGDFRTGSITVTITNTGTTPVTHVSARLVLEDNATSVGTGCTRVDGIAESCGDYSIAAGKSVTFALPIKIRVSLVTELVTYGPVDRHSVVQVRVDGRRSVQTQGLGRTVFDSL